MKGYCIKAKCEERESRPDAKYSMIKDLAAFNYFLVFLSHMHILATADQLLWSFTNVMLTIVAVFIAWRQYRDGRRQKDNS